MFSHFLNKNRTISHESVLSTRSVPVGGYPTRQNVASLPLQVAANVTDLTFTCVYCGDKVAVRNTRHELYECSAANRIYDPGPNESYAAITPMARRGAALTQIRLLDENSSSR